jgi:hypothetical protein
MPYRRLRTDDTAAGKFTREIGILAFEEDSLFITFIDGSVAMDELIGLFSTVPALSFANSAPFCASGL